MLSLKRPLLITLVVLAGTGSAFAAPTNPEDYNIQSGQMLDIENGAHVEGSINHGGLQPDYVIDMNSPAMQAVLGYAAEVGQSELPYWKQVKQIKDFIRDEVLVRKAYANPTYRRLMKKYRDLGSNIPLSAYIECKAGVCRENGMLLHLALKAAGIPSHYVYAKVTQGTGRDQRTEGHGFAVVEHDGRSWVVDSYNRDFNGAALDELMSHRGVGPKSAKAPIGEPAATKIWIEEISPHPTVWNPKVPVPVFPAVIAPLCSGILK